MTVQQQTVAGGGAGDFMTVTHLTVRGSQTEIGRVLAEHARDSYGWQPRPAEPVLAGARRRWFERNWPQHHARLLGVAAATGTRPDSAHLDGLGGIPAGSGCSATAYPPSATDEGNTLLGRNYDFFTTSMSALVASMTGAPQPATPEPPVSSRPYVLTTVPDDGPASTLITMNELDGAMEGVNEHGLAVALLIADGENATPPGDTTPQVGLSSVQLPRFLLDTCATAEEAERALLDAKQYDHGMPLHYLVADAHGDAFVWERGRDGHEHAIRADGALCVTNHPLHRHPDPARLPADNDETMLSYGRYQRLHKESATTTSARRLRDTLDEVAFGADTYAAYPVRTLWQSVFDLGTRTMSTRFYLADDRYSPEIVFTASA
ncbi:C45 family autoproteolytic acyltransferase/hydolase [Amycolatopsis suaedae]|uniref:Linear amide C-N hydrolase n=1 Tax=Amycolatopsis suaedae TaxID=2510978 RepID=A0A4Q7JA30_9PSEU|nr:C45 family peptidase [Amycolatopsis suaedae]RZQ63816.1 linear amide C-N hydrolase [Amycolatopsis suaedae]